MINKKLEDRGILETSVVSYKTIFKDLGDQIEAFRDCAAKSDKLKPIRRQIKYLQNEQQAISNRIQTFQVSIDALTLKSEFEGYHHRGYTRPAGLGKATVFTTPGDSQMDIPQDEPMEEYSCSKREQ